MPPKFSIIIPVYNVAPYLRKCLDSVLAQTFTDWEAICVNDGSTDDSGKILDEYVAKDSRFRVIHQTNAGVSAARQKALSSCAGNYLMAVDPDDWVDKDWLATYSNTIVENVSADVVWGGYIIESNDGVRRISNEASENAENHLKELLLDKIWGSLWFRAISLDFIRRHDISFPPAGCNTAEDLVFVSLVLVHNPVMKRVDNFGYHYVQREGSLCHPKEVPTAFDSYIRSVVCLREKMFGILQEDFIRYREEQIKFGMYDKIYIPNEKFRSTFPDVKVLRIVKSGWWHKVLFVLAVFGLRMAVIRLLSLIRFLKGI